MAAWTNRSLLARMEVGAVEFGHDLGVLCLFEMPALRAAPPPGHVPHHHVIIWAVGLYTGGEVVHVASVCLRNPRR